MIEEVKEKEDFIEDDDALYRVTEEAILYNTLDDYGISVGDWKPKLWQSITNTFMEGLVKAGYVKEVEKND